MKITHSSIATRRQSHEGERIATLDNGTVIKARIKRDAYDFQSYAVVEVLTTEAGFKTLLTEDATALRIWSVSYTSTDIDRVRDLLDVDLAALLVRGAKVLGQ